MLTNAFPNLKTKIVVLTKSENHLKLIIASLAVLTDYKKHEKMFEVEHISTLEVIFVHVLIDFLYFISSCTCSFYLSTSGQCYIVQILTHLEKTML